jgi:integrase/recombinase XerD
MTNFEFLIDGFMLYCTSRNLSKKSMMAYEQTLKLFSNYMCSEFKITDVQKTTSTHIRYYIKYLKERGKYTVTARNESVLRISATSGH